MLEKIVEQYFVIPPQRKPSVFSKCYSECTDDIRGRAEFLSEELIKLTREGKISWRVCRNKDMCLIAQDDCVVVIRRIPLENKTGLDRFILDVFGKEESDRADNFCGDRKNQNAFLPIVDLWDVVVEGNLREIAARHICGSMGFNPKTQICPACNFVRRQGD